MDTLKHFAISAVTVIVVMSIVNRVSFLKGIVNPA